MPTIGLGLLVFFATVAAILMLPYLSKGPRRWIRLSVLALSIGIISIPAWYETAGPHHAAYVVAVYEDGRHVTSDFGVSEIGATAIFNVQPLSGSISWSEVTPITENPKVRPVHYRVTTKLRDIDRFLTKERIQEIFEHKNRGQLGFASSPETIDRAMQRVVNYHLYEFNNANSKEVALLYNPLDKEQQGQFKQLLLPWLNERLAGDGLEAVDAYFWLD